MGNTISNGTSQQGTSQHETHHFKPKEVIDDNVIRRLDRTAYLLKNKLIIRHEARWVALQPFTLTKEYHTDDWKIIVEK